MYDTAYIHTQNKYLTSHKDINYLITMINELIIFKLIYTAQRRQISNCAIRIILRCTKRYVVK